MAATLATACGDDNNDDNSVPVESITLNHETLTLKSGATETLVPTIVPDRVTAEIILSAAIIIVFPVPLATKAFLSLQTARH